MMLASEDNIGVNEATDSFKVNYCLILYWKKDSEEEMLKNSMIKTF